MSEPPVFDPFGKDEFDVGDPTDATFDVAVFAKHVAKHDQDRKEFVERWSTPHSSRLQELSRLATKGDGAVVEARDVDRPRVATTEARRAYGDGFPSFDLHHICGNRWCKNPEHLVAVTPADHRKIHARETHCE